MCIGERAPRIRAARLASLGRQGLISLFLLFSLSALPSFGAERDLALPRVPPQHLAEAKALKNPFKPTPENIEKGRAIFEEKGTCFACHGKEGRGDGLAAAGLDPSPRNFTNAAFHPLRTDGELFWVLTHGSPGTAMMPMVGSVINESEAWLVILFERSLSGK